VRFVLASGNRHKLGEFAAILAPYEVLPMPPGIALPPEGIESFEANARIKALALAEAFGGDRELRAALAAHDADQAGRRAAFGDLEDVLFFADDSGLEVEALGWAPGVTSARYAGVDGPGADRANYTRLLRELTGLAGAGALSRRARFTCTVVAVTPGMEHYVATGHWWGAIADAPRGEGGFGYDPVFVPEGSDLTVAEWPQELKDQASHRALAGRALLDRLRQERLLDGADKERA
jgi:XTP/dITP diphosphohydrolase